MAQKKLGDNNKMAQYINENGYICYVKSGYQMSGDNPHHLYEHKEDIEQICNEIVNQKLDRATNAIMDTIPQIIDEYGRTVWTQLINNLVGALETDVHSQVKIGFDGLRDVFMAKNAKNM